MEAQPIEWTTDKILIMLGINTQGARNGIQEDMLAETKGIGHLNEKDAERIQAACGGYAKRTLVNGIFVVTRVQPKRLISLMYWVKDQRRLRETTKIFNYVDEPTLRTMIEEANEQEPCKKKQKRKGEGMITDDFQVKLESAIK